MKGPFSRIAAPLALLVVALALGCGAADERPPNILLMIADDQSWRDYGFMGSEGVHTPNLDALARGGFVFDHGFNTASACQPSLRTLLTGLEPLQFAAVGRALARRATPLEQVSTVSLVDTLPRRLAERRYVSFQGGKHWEGHYALAGFSEGMSTGPGAEAFEGGVDLKQLSGGSSLALGRRTMKPLFDFIDRHTEEPFFVWFAPMLPHVPHNPGTNHKRYYPIGEFSAAERGYFGNVTRLDARVGELLAHLERRGLRERTLVIFLSDNGWDQLPNEQGDGSPLGGPKGKLSIYENGFRTPIVFSWPGRIAPGGASSRLVSTVDLFPTILEAAGVVEKPTIRQGESLLPLLEGRGQPTRTRVMGGVSWLRSEDSTRAADPARQAGAERAYFLRESGWRYVWYQDRDREELYEIARDPWERIDVIDQHPVLVARLRAELVAWISQMSEIELPAAAPGSRVRRNQDNRRPAAGSRDALPR